MNMHAIPKNAASLIVCVGLLSAIESRADLPNAYVIWDQGPYTGLVSIGGNNALQNQQEYQRLADSVQFAANTSIVGFNLFTGPREMPPGGDTYRVSFYADNAGLPGTLVAQRDVGAL